MKSRLLLALALATATGGPTFAHHFLVASYYLDRTVTLDGRVVSFLFRNPHSFVQVECTDRGRRIETWLAEWSAGSQLGRSGVAKDSLKPGDGVIVTGNPPRNPAEHKVRVVSIVRSSDGWRWSEQN